MKNALIDLKTLTLPLSSRDVKCLEDGGKVRGSFVLKPFTVLAVVWNSGKDRVFRRNYEKLLQHNISIVNIPLSSRDIARLKQGKIVSAQFPSVKVNLLKVPSCPSCGATLRQLPNGVYECQSERIQLCVHMLAATRRDKDLFSCSVCATTVSECDCDDCFVFCKNCGTVLLISCEQLSVINKKRRLGGEHK